MKLIKYSVTFTINRELFSFYDKNMKWVVEPGDFTIMVGTSSDKSDGVTLRVII